MTFHPRERSPWRRPMSRREMLGLMAGTAVAGGLLAGCGSLPGAVRPRDSRSGPGRTRSSSRCSTTRPRIESGLEPEEGPLRVYNWADYINPAVLKGFTKEFGNEVEVTTFYNLAGSGAEAEDRQDQLRRLLPHAGRSAEVRRGQAAAAAQPRLHPQPEEERLADARRPLLRQKISLHRPLRDLQHGHRMADGHGYD